MQAVTLLLIILSAVVALLLALYQYSFRVRRMTGLQRLLATLRFLALFGLLLLLVNPRFTREQYRLERANLVLLADNSSSMAASNSADQLRDISDQLLANSDLRERFELRRYSFGAGLNATDSLTFNEGITDISGTLASLNGIYSGSNTAVVLLTDGNQTLGADYEFYGDRQKFPVYPVVMGDTTRYEDLRIDQVNVNAYAFLDNKYPVECHLSYQGNNSAEVNFSVQLEGRTVYREQLTLSRTSNSKVVSALIEANSIGVKQLTLSLNTLPNERNPANNRATAVVEVIDEKTKIVMVSDLIHPDLGALRNSITQNEQRSVTILASDTPAEALEDTDLFILYQPTSAFRPIYRYISEHRINFFTIAGTQTDWNFLNGVQNSYVKEILNQSEEITPVRNAAFTTFDISDFAVEDFPPLEAELGEILITKPNETLLGQSARGVDLDEPLLAIINSNSQKEALLLGEHIWKWRMQAYRNEGDFRNFDTFMGKLMLYMTSDQSRSRLNLAYDNVFRGASEAVIRAEYFDEAFAFNRNAVIDLSVRNAKNELVRDAPMLLKRGHYEADLSDLKAGDYTFKAAVKGEALSAEGRFTILDFDIENQLVSSDFNKLGRLALATSGKHFFPAGIDSLIRELSSDARYVPTEKSQQNVVSLIDFEWLLAIIAASLTAEWFIRKYNGLL